MDKNTTLQSAKTVQKNHLKEKNTAENYYSFWIKGSKRNLFLNYTQSVSRSYIDKDGDKKLSNKDEYWFHFDEPFIENLKYASFI